MIYLHTRFPRWVVRVESITKNIFCVVDKSGDRIILARRNRIIKYSKGIATRLAEIDTKYFLGEIDFINGDLVIDVGANIGEVGMAILKCGNTIQLLAVEPDPVEFECLQMNLGLGHTYVNAFLFSDNISMPAIFENASGDTRLTPEFNERPDRYVEVQTLDSLMHGQSFEKIRLLKIEVEGSEPEVLQGAKETLRKAEYVALDTSLERGAELLSTFESCHRILTDSGFRLIRRNRKESALYARVH